MRARPDARRSPRVLIVGGGISGLSAAHHVKRLACEHGLPVGLSLLEASSRLGGQIRSEVVGDLLLEAGADSLVAQKPAGQELCVELGLADELVRLDSTVPTMQILHRGRLVPLPPGFMMLAPTRIRPWLGSPLFSWRGKARVLCDLFIPPKAPPHEDESLRDFVTRRLGREAFERAAEPILAGLFTADADRLSMEMTAPRFLDLERAHGSLIRGLQRALGNRRASGGGFVWLRRGMGSLVDRLADELDGDDLRLGTRVDAVTRDPAVNRWLAQPAGGATLDVDAVILACPSFAAARLLRGHDDELAGELDELRYASCATVNLLYRRTQVRGGLDGLGFFVPRTERLGLLACSYVSAKFRGRVPGDRVLLRVFLGGALDPQVLDGGDAELVARAHDALRDLLRIEGLPLFSRVHRHPHSMPQYPVGDRGRLSSVRQRLENHPGLFLAGGALGAMGIPDCVRSGERSARMVMDHLTTERRSLQLVV